MKLICTEDLLKRLRAFKDQVSVDIYEECAMYKKYILLGMCLNKLLGCKKYHSSFFYELILFRDKAAMDEYVSNAPTVAKKLINKYIVPTHPEEGYVAGVKRKSDMCNYVLGTYEGRFIQLDMNSAEPYVLSLLCPEIEPVVQELYAARRNKAVNKRILNCLNGNLRNTHPSLYLDVCDNLYNIMQSLRNTMEDAGAEALSFRRDGMLFWVPDNFVLPDIGVGNEMGDFKVVGDGHGKIHFYNALNYNSEVPEIDSKNTGVVRESALQRVKMYGNKITKRGLIIYE